jgi:hypothetical protein
MLAPPHSPGARAGARGNDDRIRRVTGTRPGVHGSGVGVQAGGRVAEHPPGTHLVDSGQRLRGEPPAGQDLLRQRGAIIGRVSFGTENRYVTLESECAQGLGGSQAGEGCSDNQHAVQARHVVR